MMADLIRRVVERLKKVSVGVWFVCALVVLVGGWLIAVITKPPSADELQRRADHEYTERYNKFQPSEKTPEHDSKTYGMIKRDGRYFLVPRSYSSAFGFAFFWPKELDSFYRSTVTKDEAFNTKRGLAGISVFMESKRFRISNPDQPKIDLSNPESCSAPLGTPKSWNGLIVWLRFDNSHDKDWPQICLEIVRILSLVKEVKNHE